MLRRALILRVVAGAALLLAVTPAFAQGVPDDQSTGVTISDQPTDGSGTGSDQSAPPAQADGDPQAVIAQWGPAPEMGHDADLAIARRWLRDQEAYRDRWGIPGVSRDPYLDWEAANELHTFLHEPLEPRPAGLTKPQTAVQSPEEQVMVRQHESYWPVPDDLWQGWLDSYENIVPGDWELAHPGEPWFTRDNYMRAQVWRGKAFDRFRLFGVAGRVNTADPPVPLLYGPRQVLEQMAPGSLEAYQPVDYKNSLIAIVAYDPWLNPDGSLRP